MKKSIITLLLASFILTEISPLACSAIGNKNSNEPKKVQFLKVINKDKKVMSLNMNTLTITGGAILMMIS